MRLFVKCVLVVMMMVLTMSLGAASEVRLDRVFLSDVTAGELYAYVQLENTMDAQLENVHVTVTLPELGVRRRATLYQVDEDSYAHARLYLDLPDVKGEYIARVTVSDGYGEVRRTVHRYVYII